MALNTNIRPFIPPIVRPIQPQMLDLSALSDRINQKIKNKRENAFELSKVVNELEDKAPLFEANQLYANDKIEKIKEEIGRRIRENKKNSFLGGLTDSDTIEITALAKKLEKEFISTRQTEAQLTKTKEMVDNDMGKTIDAEDFYTNVYLPYRETRKLPEGRPLTLPMPKNFNDAILERNKARASTVKPNFAGYEKGMRVTEWDPQATESEKRNDIRAILSDPAYKRGLEFEFEELPEEKKKEYVLPGIDPLEYYAVKEKSKLLYPVQRSTTPMTATEKGEGKPKQERWSISDNVVGAGGQRGRGVIMAKDEKVQIPIDLARKITGQKIDSTTGFVTMKPELVINGKVQGVITEPITTKRKYLTEDEAGSYGSKRRVENVPKPKADWDKDDKKMYEKGETPMNELYYIEENVGGKPITIEANLQEISPYMYSSMPGLEDFLRNNNMNINARSTKQPVSLEKPEQIKADFSTPDFSETKTGTRQQLEEAARLKGMTIDQYKEYLESKGYTVIIK